MFLKRSLGVFVLLTLANVLQAAPQFQTFSQAVSASDLTTLTIAAPAGTVQGDFLLATISADDNPTITAPLGWTQLDQGQASGGSAETLAVFYRVATEVEPANNTFTLSVAQQAAGAILRYSGVSTSNPIDVFGSATGDSNTPTSPSVAALSADTRVVRIYGADDDDLNANPYPSGTTGRLNIESSNAGGSTSLGVADSTQAATGATNTAAFALTASEQWRALTVVLAPSGINPLPANDTNNAPAVCTAASADGAGSITGTVNRYYPGSASVLAGATSITLGTSIGTGGTIAIGDSLLVIQMQDATIDSTNNANYGDASGAGTADGSGSTSIRQTGLYEFAVAANAVGAGGGSLQLVAGLTHAYNNGTNRKFQVVRVPRYLNLTLTGTVAATPWDGLAGGIVAMNVQGALNLNGNTINVSGQGFRGGDFTGGTIAGAAGDSSTDYVVVAGTRWGAKGEGIAGGPNVGPMVNTSGYTGGSLARGAPGNAGGGGNDHNSGGGGGSNIGSGGRGGFPFDTGTVNGKGGASFAGYSGRLLAGGGGGAGHKNNGNGIIPNSAFGGNGGGVVFINVGTITGTGSILADGSAGINSIQDGAGGGGAGGTILIRTSSASVAGLTLSATGGDGGDIFYTDGHGPGGGGGGGAIYTNATVGSTNITGGSPGWRRDTSGGPQLTNHGALAGYRGQVTALTDVPRTVACDYGDAPTGYATPTSWHSVDSAGGASSNLRLGTLVDFEWQGDASSDALADNTRDTSGSGAGSDEDGVTFSSPSGGGANIIAAVAVANTTGSTARVCGWMDIGAPPNGTFDLAEQQCSNVATGGTTSVNFQWIVSSTTTQTYNSRFRVCLTAVQCETPSGQALSGEMEDYSIIYNPTHVSMGEVTLSVISVEDLLAEIQQGDGSALRALELLAFYDPWLAESLQDAEASVIFRALEDYLDPDGDGRLAAIRWETLEERGTVGFYVERRELQGGGNWQRLNEAMLPGLITAPMGGEYWLADPLPQSGQTFQYQLIEVEARGDLRTYGPWSLSLSE